ncbi:MAG TPA: hypothetical protein VGR62_11585 [Candidatus Binatia bacterium]|jgi:hypothetical protein|nr:hypothetical protein [Candidatus Binatia bacterium]
MTPLLRLGLIGALSLVVATQSASALVLCAKRSGQIVATERCKRRDTPLAPADVGIIGLPGPTGVAGPPGPNGQIPLRIVDANGRDVCRVINGGAEPECVLEHPVLPRPVLLAFESLPIETGMSVGSSTAYYLQADCGGPPHVRSPRPLLPSASLIGHALFYASGEESLIMPFSFEDVQEPCTGTPTTRGTCCQPYTSMSGRFAAPATLVEVATLELVFPFTAVTP